MLRRLIDTVLKPVRKRLFSVLLAGGVLSFSWDAEGGGAVSEYALKAAFIYNFAKFIDWPKREDGRLHLCVLGDEMFDGELQRLEGRLVGPLRVQTHWSVWPQLPPACQILFISESESENLPQILKSIQDQRVLTIGDSKGFLDRGVMIEMLLDEGRISFEVNMVAARKGNLPISSKLLRLAKRVY